MVIRVGLILLVLALGAVRAAAGPGSIEVRSTARVPEGRAVTLGDVAQLAGSAERLRDLVVLDTAPAPADGWRKITIASIRSALNNAGVDWAITTLTGTDAQLRTIPARQNQADTAGPAPSNRTVSRVHGTATLRQAVLAHLETLFDADRETMRVEFARGSDDLLNTPTAGRVVEITRIGRSRRVTLTITIYDGDSIALQRTVRVGVQLHMDVVVARRPVERHAELADTDIATERRWVEGGVIYATTRDAIGAIARRTLEPGHVLRTSDVEPPVVIRRGDIAVVHCVSGSIVLRVQARAMREARAGEVIEFERLGDDHRMTARVLSRGRAIARADDGGLSAAGPGGNNP